VGEDKALLQAKPFADALLRCRLLPEARGNKFVEETTAAALYDISNVDYKNEMLEGRSRTVAFINLCYELAENSLKDNPEVLSAFILSNRGTYAFISLIGDLHLVETTAGTISIKSTAEQRLEAIEKYLLVLFKALTTMGPEESEALTGKLGSGAETTWLRVFQSFINVKFKDYDPPELQDWRERQDKALQNRGRELGTKIERHMKAFVIAQLRRLFDENWDIEIGSIQRECEKRAKEQMEKNYKEGLGRQEIPWTEQFTINDYKTIIEKYWNRKPGDDTDFETFEEHFSIDVGHGFHSKSDKIKWLSIFNSLRNNWAHEGTKEKGLNKQEVDLIYKIYTKLGLE
jgi:DNA sulfur modification protein DndB